MACPDCFNGCDDTLTSDRCVKYTGSDVNDLDICSTDSQKDINDAVISELLAHRGGDDIVIDGLTGCNSILTLFTTDPPTLKNTIQALYTSYCSLKSAVTTLQSGPAPFSFNVGCLTGLTANSSRDQITQALITQYCVVSASVTNILADYVKASELTTLIASYLQTVNNTTVVNQYSNAIPYVAYEYYGPMSNFDSSGKGLASLGFDKMFLCNGANGTPDKRGRVAVGAIAGVPGGALDSAVDPSLPANSGTNYALKDKFGASNITLIVSQMPSHSHSITDPGHKHNLNPDAGSQQVHRSGDTGHAYRTEDFATSAVTTVSTTGITIASTGNSQPHSNVQPSIAANFIMYIP